MSRVGKKLINIPSGVDININDAKLTIKGKHGLLEREINPSLVSVDLVENTFSVKCLNNSKKGNSYHGLIRALVQNMITGVNDQFTRVIIAEGVGYKFQIENKNLIVNAGYSHPVKIEIPSDLTMKIESPTRLSIIGIDKEKVGFMASKIHDIRPPEPYKGKGLLYLGEKIIRKAGKTGK